MDNPNTTDLITAEQPTATAATLDALPGIIGGIDQALIDATKGTRLPFVLLVFADGGAMHATNIVPASNAVAAVKDLAKVWDTTDPVAQGGGDATGGPAA